MRLFVRPFTACFTFREPPASVGRCRAICSRVAGSITDSFSFSAAASEKNNGRETQTRGAAPEYHAEASDSGHASSWHGIDLFGNEQIGEPLPRNAVSAFSKISRSAGVCFTIFANGAGSTGATRRRGCITRSSSITKAS